MTPQLKIGEWCSDGGGGDGGGGGGGGGYGFLTCLNSYRKQVEIGDCTYYLDIWDTACLCLCGL